MPVKIIIVEDDNEVREILKQLLSYHYDVTDVANAKTALEILQQSKGFFDIAIIDLWMPGMNGLTLIEKMGEDEQLSKISIIIITGIVKDQELPNSFWSKSLGVDAFFQKPFNPEELIIKVDEIMRKRLNLPKDDHIPGGYL